MTDGYKISKMYAWEDQVWPDKNISNVLYFWPLTSDLKDHKAELWWTWTMYDLTWTNYTQNNGYITMGASSKIITTASNVPDYWNLQDVTFAFTARNMASNYSSRLYQAVSFIIQYETNDTNMWRGYWGICNWYNMNGSSSDTSWIWTPSPRDMGYWSNSISEIRDIKFTSSSWVKFVLVWEYATRTRKWYANWNLIKTLSLTSSRTSLPESSWYVRLWYNYYQNYASEARCYRWDLKNVILCKWQWSQDEINIYNNLP